jgi:hypothetical protein
LEQPAVQVVVQEFHLKRLVLGYCRPFEICGDASSCHASRAVPYGDAHAQGHPPCGGAYGDACASSPSSLHFWAQFLEQRTLL